MILNQVADHWEALAAHARAWYPRECCALIVRDTDGGTELVLADNLADERHRDDPRSFPRTAATAYVLDTRLVIAAERAGKSVVAIVHSHCDVGAYFSDEDQRLATLDVPGAPRAPLYPDVDYVVIDVSSKGVHGFAVFTWSDEVGRFTPL